MDKFRETLRLWRVLKVRSRILKSIQYLTVKLLKERIKMFFE